MNPFARPRGVLAPALALALAAAVAGEARAQAATITGRVTNEQGAPLTGATIAIQSMRLGTQSGSNGAYTLVVPDSIANGQQVTLIARNIGFAPIERPITLSAGSQTVDFALQADPFRLSEMVVTGVSEATSQRLLPFSVGRVSEEQIAQVPATSPVAALQGKVAGARIGLGTGNPGAAPVVRLRGSTNLTVGGSQPMIIVDGVITKGSLADIDANTIASIEVLKGAAAASFYGSDAANGVINITTKRGENVADGETQFILRSEYGQSGLQRYVPVSKYHHYQLDADGQFILNPRGQRVPEADGIADNEYPTTGPNQWRNQLDQWLENGSFYSTNLQILLRRGNTNVGSSFTVDRNAGILPFRDGQLRQNARINVDQGFSDKLDLSMSVSYGINKNDYAPTSTDGWFALLQAPPDVDLVNPNPAESDVPYYTHIPTDISPSQRGNPLYQLANEEYSLRRERIIGSVTGRWRPLDWLRFEGTYGTDRMNGREETYQFRGYLSSSGAVTPGSLDIDTDQDVSYNAQASAIASTTLFGNLTSNTRLTYLYESTEDRELDVDATQFRVSQTPVLDAFDNEQATLGSSLESIRTRDVFVAQDLDWRNKYILSALYRRDGSSLFGERERWADFYRVAGAYVLSEDFTIPGVDLLKLRAARGTAGLRPNFSWQYETFALSAGVPTKLTIGNPDLKPAVVTENEFGLDLAFLGRFSAELVYADRVTEGAFLEIPLSTAQKNGYRRQWQNAADISSESFELALNALVVNRPNLTYNVTVTADRTRQRIDRMNRAPFRVSFTGQGQNQDAFYYAAGQPLGIVYGTRFIRDPRELLDSPKNANDPTFNIGNYVVNPEGYVTHKDSLGTPVAYVNANGESQHVIGNVNPDFGFGIANTVTWKNFTVYALLDGVKGGDIYNFTKQWMYQDHRHGTQAQGDKPVDQRVPLAFYSNGLYNGNLANTHFVEDGSFVKLRELSVNYTLSQSLLSRIHANRYVSGVKLALIGRNLYTWTDYSGFDPDVASGGDFNFRIDGFRYPNFRQISGQIELTF